MKRRQFTILSACLSLLLILGIPGVGQILVRAGESTLIGVGGDPDETDVEEMIRDRVRPAPFYMRIRFDEDFETLKEEDTRDWVGKKGDGTFVWNDEPIIEYFNELKEKYDTPMGVVSFTTHDGEEMEIESHNCGWHMNVDFSIENLKVAVEEGKHMMDPAWNSGLVYSSKNGVGSKYVEIDIEEQKVYLYEDDELVFDTDCVTGTQGYSDTTPGVFQVTGKASPSVLRDVDKNGNKYEQPVTYWIPFNGSQGMHDATWRGSFGGTIYQSWGSHGCVNLPLESAKKIYEEVYVYYPVIVY